MIRIYGMPSCKDCAYVHEQLAGRETEYAYIDIGENVRQLKDFLLLRDHLPVFDLIKEQGKAGIPCFVLEDGRVTLIPEEAGLKSRPQEDSGCEFC